MNGLEVILTVVIAAAVIGVIALMIRNKKKGKGCCSGCSGCSVSNCPHRK